MTGFFFGILIGIFIGASVVSFFAVRKIEAIEDAAWRDSRPTA